MAMLGLLAGIWTGLNRIGWSLSPGPVNFHHGAIMVGGFVGTLIALEKVIPLKRKIAYGIPLLSGVSVIAAFAGFPATALMLLVIASLALSLVFLFYLFRHRNRIYLLMWLGSVCWLVGNAIIATGSLYPLAFPWWLAFGLFVIAAERLELTRFLPVGSRSKNWLAGFLGVYLLGALLSFHGPGQVVSGLALCAVALWLMRNDVIGMSLHKSRLPRFIAVALMCGYLSLLLTGIFFLALDDHAMAYDTVVHTFFIGFIFSMIFAHGPVILPGVLGATVKPYHPVLYFWLILLHASWLVRIGGNLLLDFQARRASGLMSATAMLAYFITMAVLTRLSLVRHAQAR